MLTTEDYRLVYRMTDKVTPLSEDCGKLCNKICCRPGSKNELGIYLYPGEETMFTRRENWLKWEEQNPEEQFFPSSWPNPVYFVRCTNPCPREARPLACRFFPLTPHLQMDGSLHLIYETLELPYICPLILETRPLEKQFISTAYTAWQILLQDRRIYELVEDDSRYREDNNFPIQAVCNR